MKECADLDSIIGVEQALGWNAEERLRHIVSCDECLTQVRQVERLHSAFDRDVAPSPAFADRVLGSLPSKTAPVPENAERHSWLLTAAIFMLACVTTVPLLMLAATVSAVDAGPGPEIVILALGVGLAAVKLTPRAAA